MAQARDAATNGAQASPTPKSPEWGHAVPAGYPRFLSLPPTPTLTPPHTPAGQLQLGIGLKARVAGRGHRSRAV